MVWRSPRWSGMVKQKYDDDDDDGNNDDDGNGDDDDDDSDGDLNTVTHLVTRLLLIKVRSCNLIHE